MYRRATTLDAACTERETSYSRSCLSHQRRKWQKLRVQQLVSRYHLQQLAFPKQPWGRRHKLMLSREEQISEHAMISTEPKSILSHSWASLKQWCYSRKESKISEVGEAIEFLHLFLETLKRTKWHYLRPAATNHNIVRWLNWSFDLMRLTCGILYMWVTWKAALSLYVWV